MSAYSVTFTEAAFQDFFAPTDYIVEKGYPETATKYGNRLLAFCQALSNMLERHPLCKNIFYKMQGYSCSVFEKTYIVAFKVEDEKVVVKRIVHGKTLG